MNRIYIAAILFAWALTFSSCDNEVQIPSYLTIEGVNLSTESGQGFNSHKISYCWLYIDNEFYGGYPIPVTLPVIGSGTKNIKIDFGVQQNGFSSNPVPYPFYNRINETIDLIENDTVSYTFGTTYTSTAKFPLLESFNNSVHLFTSDLDSDGYGIVVDHDAGLEGGAGHIHLDTSHPGVVAGTDANEISLEGIPKNGIGVFLEVDYKNEVPIIFGVIAYDFDLVPTTYSEFGLIPKDDWNKVYLDLTQIFIQPQFETFIIFVDADLQYSTEGLEEADVYLDNIKLVHYN